MFFFVCCLHGLCPLHPQHIHGVNTSTHTPPWAAASLAARNSDFSTLGALHSWRTARTAHVAPAPPKRRICATHSMPASRRPDEMGAGRPRAGQKHRLVPTHCVHKCIARKRQPQMTHVPQRSIIFEHLRNSTPGTVPHETATALTAPCHAGHLILLQIAVPPRIKGCAIQS